LIKKFSLHYNNGIFYASVADPACLSRIRIFHLRFRIAKASDPGPATKNLSIFYPNNCYLAPGNIIRGVYCGSRIQYFFHPGSRGKKTLDPGSATLFYTATVVAPS